MKNLLYFDVEYANSKNKSICQMGMMIRNDEGDDVYPELEVLVNPEDEFDPHCVNVHHITKETVKDAKPFNEIWKNIEKYFINSIVVGYNVCGSDIDAVCKNLIRYNIALPEIWYIDVYSIVQDWVPSYEVGDYHQGSVCKFFDIDLGEEHNAFDDACACADLLATLVDEYEIDINNYIKHYTFDADYSFSPYLCKLSVTREINLLLGSVKGILVDGEISEGEVQFLINWRKEHSNLSEDENGSKVLTLIDDILTDNIVTIDEAKELLNLIINVTQNLSASVETKATQELQGFINAIKSDEVLDDEEVLSIQKWLYNNDYLVGHYPYDKVKNAIDKVLEDKIVTEDEKAYLMNLFDELFNPVKELIKSTIEFNNKDFCLSGDFEHGSKKDIEEYIMSKGGTISQSVRKKTNYVVVGSLGSQVYSNGNYGTKVKKAMESNIPVITEKQLYDEI